MSRPPVLRATLLRHGELRYGSVCSGIEAATVAWHPLGWRAQWFAEIEPFPSAVLAHRFPEVPNLGDFTKIPADVAPIDLLVGGTPCQSFSVAGLRGGMGDARGNLALEFLRLADRTRPKWLVWENVPGVLSSGGGRDFGSILGGMVELGYGFAYRVLDAQFVGGCALHGDAFGWGPVPQRRRRVFVVARLGDWRAAAACLFERACLRWDPETSGEEREGSAASTGGGAVGGCPPVSPALKARNYKGPSSDGDGAPLLPVAHSLRASGFDASEDGTGRGTPLVPVEATTFDWQAGSSGDTSWKGKARSFIVDKPGRTRSMTAQRTLAVAIPAIAFHSTQDPISGTVSPALSQGNSQGCGSIAVCIQDGRGLDNGQNGLGISRPGSPAYTLDTLGVQAVLAPMPFDLQQVTSKANRSRVKPGRERHTLAKDNAAGAAVAIPAPFNSATEFLPQSSRVYSDGEQSPALQATGKRMGNHAPLCQQAMQVRRLTPRECERLQAFPDDWTRIPWRGAPAEECPDGPRYKAIGNSMATTVMAWIGKRIEMVERMEARRAKRK